MANINESISLETFKLSQNTLLSKSLMASDCENTDVPQTPLALNPASTEPHIAILLCTKDGERFLDEQLESIRNQYHKNIHLYASDDGSIDNTLHILNMHQERWSKERFSIKIGPQQGYAANFLSLACSPKIEADYYAFSDQDDIWDQDKITRAISKLDTVSPGTPALYCSRTQLIEANGVHLGRTPLYRRPPSFANSLVQSIGSGNAMVFNRAAREILYQAGQLQIASHDWWAYSLISGAGGVVIYDPLPGVRYRQHDRNVLGASPGLKATLLRIRLILKGRFQNWNTININALRQSEKLLAPENRETLDIYTAARTRSILPRALGIWRSGVYRQTYMSNLGLFVATLLNKV
ncbi:MAG: glycosyltransferase family 2 protein [Candidatus Reddybacter sp.]